VYDQVLTSEFQSTDADGSASLACAAPADVNAAPAVAAVAAAVRARNALLLLSEADRRAGADPGAALCPCSDMRIT
jgi:hypothetical protein